MVRDESYVPLTESTTARAIQLFDRHQTAAALIQWVLDDGPGLELCRQMRERDAVLPILMLHDYEDEANVVRAFDAGADDFVTVPFQAASLVARLEAHLRKAAVIRNSLSDREAASVRTFGAVLIDTRARAVAVDGRPVRLGTLEFSLLELLASDPGRAFSRSEILAAVYGIGTPIRSDRVDLLIQHLRGKLGKGEDRGDQIVSVRGYGYRLERRFISSRRATG